MTFYDYDITVRRDGTVEHHLRANMKALYRGDNFPMTAFCTVRELPNGLFERKTRWASKPSTRYVTFKNLDEALASGIAWAKRRKREDDR